MYWHWHCIDYFLIDVLFSDFSWLFHSCATLLSSSSYLDNVPVSRNWVCCVLWNNEGWNNNADAKWYYCWTMLCLVFSLIDASEWMMDILKHVLFTRHVRFPSDCLNNFRVSRMTGRYRVWNEYLASFGKLVVINGFGRFVTSCSKTNFLLSVFCVVRNSL